MIVTSLVVILVLLTFEDHSVQQNAKILPTVRTTHGIILKISAGAFSSLVISIKPRLLNLFAVFVVFCKKMHR